MELTPQLQTLDAEAHRVLGKGLMQCTRDDLHHLATLAATEERKNHALAERAKILAAEVKSCGCTIKAPYLPDGEMDIANAFVAHTCGRSDRTALRLRRP
jgi:hypothetical protein